MIIIPGIIPRKYINPFGLWAVAVVEDVFDVDLILKKPKRSVSRSKQFIRVRIVGRAKLRCWPAKKREARYIATATGPSVISPLLHVLVVSVAPHHNQQRKREKEEKSNAFGWIYSLWIIMSPSQFWIYT